MGKGTQERRNLVRRTLNQALACLLIIPLSIPLAYSIPVQAQSIPNQAPSQIAPFHPINNLGGIPQKGSALTLEQQLQLDIEEWDPRALLNLRGDHDVEYVSDQLRAKLDAYAPELEPQESEWLSVRDRVAERAAQVGEEMMSSLESTTFRLGVTAFLLSLRNAEIDQNKRSTPFWEKLVYYLNPEESPLNQAPKKSPEILKRKEFKELELLIENHGLEGLRNLVANMKDGDESAPQLLRELIDRLGAREVAKEISLGNLGQIRQGDLRFEFTTLDGSPIVKAVYEPTNGTARSLIVRRPGQVTRHLKQIWARQNLDAGKTDQYGRKLGRDTTDVVQENGNVLSTEDHNKLPRFSELVQEHGRVIALVEYLNPKDWSARLHTYYYATVKGLARSRTVFGLASGLFQGGTTLWLASFGTSNVSPEHLALVQALTGTIIGTNLATVQNWTARGAKDQMSYTNHDWKTEQNFFKRLGKRLESIAVGPTASSRYARSLAISVSVAVIMMLVKHQTDLQTMAITGVGTTVAMLMGEIVTKVGTNTWANNKGKNGLEEFIRFLRDRRYLSDDVRIGRFEATGLAKIHVVHQALYNPTNHLFKVMDLVTPWAWYVFSVGNALQLALEVIGLRAVAMSSHRLNEYDSIEHFRRYESSLLKIIANTGKRLFTGQSEEQRQLSWLPYEDQVRLRQTLDEALHSSEPKEIRTQQIKAVQFEIFRNYQQVKEARLERIVENLKARANTAKTTVRAAVGSVVQPFAPEAYKSRIPTSNLSGLMQSCRSIFL